MTYFVESQAVTHTEWELQSSVTQTELTENVICVKHTLFLLSLLSLGIFICEILTRWGEWCFLEEVA